MTLGVAVVVLLVGLAVVVVSVVILVAVLRTTDRRDGGTAALGMPAGGLEQPGSVQFDGATNAPTRNVELSAPTLPGATRGRDADANAVLSARLGEALDQIDQALVVFDRDGQQVFRNRVAAEFSEARDGLALVDAAVLELLGEALLGRSVVREVDLFGPPAQSFIVTARPFTSGDGALALVEDVSLQRRTETVRRDFVANISHELKTPIGALGLLAETIRDEPDPAVAERLAERMIVEAHRAASTIDDLLELSRIEFGDDAEFEQVAITSIVDEAVARISPAAHNAGIAVSADIPASLRVVGDRRQLVSAVYNLLDNAVKYSSTDTEVHVGVDRSAPAAEVRLKISDSGVGIPRRDLDRVFERFYRVDRARSRRTGGTGLGLAIVRHVASNHGGSVTVDSTEGVGTTFSLRLPAATAGTAEPPGSPEPAEPAEPDGSGTA